MQLDNFWVFYTKNDFFIIYNDIFIEILGYI
jgi:hypothetical protein